MSKKVSGWPLIAPTEVDTSITGDQVLEALAADVEASDSGKVLTATYGGLEGEETGRVMWASPLPIIGEGDAGKVLTVNAGETGAEWAAAAGGGGVINRYVKQGSDVTIAANSSSSVIDIQRTGMTPGAIILTPYFSCFHSSGYADMPIVPLGYAGSSNYFPNLTTVPEDGAVTFKCVIVNPTSEQVKVRPTVYAFEYVS